MDRLILPDKGLIHEVTRTKHEARDHPNLLLRQSSRNNTKETAALEETCLGCGSAEGGGCRGLVRALLIKPQSLTVNLE